ncbi:hypothetical protein [Fimbriimonas ginsengisoli]|uniref:Uncharacterized protein n=1 Tax=Fimbriimonas ginsengisoli Gsoil 348 TaxID=661478 RepID=A0A068NSQ3_FIMGI|nr:hypothetical protein [Fimbriimonas ginsengisoli]AIE86466.1 hypothetical protein OP10G_3098 [Fimbriimonas ginsengisoli Gsoil 348]
MSAFREYAILNAIRHEAGPLSVVQRVDLPPGHPLTYIAESAKDLLGTSPEIYLVSNCRPVHFVLSGFGNPIVCISERFIDHTAVFAGFFADERYHTGALIGVLDSCVHNVCSRLMAELTLDKDPARAISMQLDSHQYARLHLPFDHAGLEALDSDNAIWTFCIWGFAFAHELCHVSPEKFELGTPQELARDVETAWHAKDQDIEEARSEHPSGRRTGGLSEVLPLEVAKQDVFEGNTLLFHGRLNEEIFADVAACIILHNSIIAASKDGFEQLELRRFTFYTGSIVIANHYLAHMNDLCLASTAVPSEALYEGVRRKIADTVRQIYVARRLIEMLERVTGPEEAFQTVKGLFDEISNRVRKVDPAVSASTRDAPYCEPIGSRLRSGGEKSLSRKLSLEWDGFLRRAQSQVGPLPSLADVEKMHGFGFFHREDVQGSWDEIEQILSSIDPAVENPAWILRFLDIWSQAFPHVREDLRDELLEKAENPVWEFTTLQLAAWNRIPTDESLIVLALGERFDTPWAGPRDLLAGLLLARSDLADAALRKLRQAKAALQKGTVDWARAHLEEGIIIAEQAETREEKLEALRLLETARTEGLEYGSRQYASCRIAEGRIYLALADLRDEPETSLRTAQRIFNEVRYEALQMNSQFTVVSLLQEANALMALAEFDGVQAALDARRLYTLAEQSLPEDDTPAREECKRLQSLALDLSNLVLHEQRKTKEEFGQDPLLHIAAEIDLERSWNLDLIEGRLAALDDFRPANLLNEVQFGALSPERLAATTYLLLHIDALDPQLQGVLTIVAFEQFMGRALRQCSGRPLARVLVQCARNFVTAPEEVRLRFADGGLVSWHRIAFNVTPNPIPDEQGRLQAAARFYAVARQVLGSALDKDWTAPLQEESKVLARLGYPNESNSLAALAKHLEA